MLAIAVTYPIKKPTFHRHFCALHLLVHPRFSLIFQLWSQMFQDIKLYFCFGKTLKQNEFSEFWILDGVSDWYDSEFTNYTIWGIKETKCVFYKQRKRYLKIKVLQDGSWVMANRTSLFPFPDKFPFPSFMPQAMNYWTVTLLSGWLACIFVPYLLAQYANIKISKQPLISAEPGVCAEQ